jgi:hypothetical protein
MNFINFERIDNEIEIIAGNKFYDLHNISDFVEFTYNLITREITLEWRYPSGRDYGIPPTDENGMLGFKLPRKLTLTFQKVLNFSIAERDDELPFSEDTCLSSIYVNNEDAGVTGNNAELEFQSGMIIKITAESVEFNIK